ncbi:hypothetical protein FHS82_001798 [Pseudochelatococcus lubricantis]|uniref:N-acetyltransferase domain-containing protein n=1 Tax=Pseudochelatococcus lubricantis TaxID=1538102 RepID=A0ABX0UYD2_9HYPH|nr:GNAT family N-acetyltransferase [Pseudochelatococcus lubricantis]NIJ57962.1 hypothetical protein [Pseudochelatococcus lubricantis]
MTQAVADNKDARRFELPVDGHVAFIDYRIETAGDDADNPVYVLEHTEVPEELGGRGVGSQLAAGALDIIRQSGGRVRSECSFISRYLSRHSDYSDIVAP